MKSCSSSSLVNYQNKEDWDYFTQPQFGLVPIAASTICHNNTVNVIFFFSFLFCFPLAQSELQGAGGGASADLHPAEGGLWSDHRDPSGAPHPHRAAAPQLHPLGGGPHRRPEAAAQGHRHRYHSHSFPPLAFVA